MAPNTAPIFGVTPNVGRATITTTWAQTKSNGTSAGSGTDQMAKVFTTGANGSWVDRVRFMCVATAATSSVATTLRVYLSTQSTPTSGTTGGTDTWLLGEVSVPIIASDSNTQATSFFDVPIGMAIPTGFYLHVSQAIAQTTNQNWQAVAMGSDY